MVHQRESENKASDERDSQVFLTESATDNLEQNELAEDYPREDTEA